MKYHLILKGILSLLFAALVTAKNHSDCEKIEHLDGIIECVEDNDGKVVKLNIKNYSVTQEVLNDLLLYKSIRSLVYDEYVVKTSYRDDPRGTINIGSFPFDRLPELTELAIIKYYEQSYGTPSDSIYSLRRDKFDENGLKLPKSLKKLTIEGVTLSQNDINEIASVTNLEELNLPKCDYSNLNLDPLKNLKNISKIELSGIVPQSLMDIFKESVKTIVLHVFHKIYRSMNQEMYNSMNGIVEDLEDLTYDFSGYTNLEVLDVSYEQKSPTLLPLKNLPNLSELNINKIFTENEIIDVDTVPNLKKISMELTSNEIPSFIYKYSSLKELIIKGNKKIDSIPDELGQLTKLEKLVLSGCSIVNSKALSNLKNLKYLDLSLSLNGVVPEEIGQLEKLESLYLWSNRLTNLPESLFNLKNLQTLDLSNNELTSQSSNINNLNNLQNLDLENCGLKEIPEFVFKIKNLQNLNLNNNVLPTLPDTIGNLKNLKNLDLSNNVLTTLPETIGKLKNLENLNLSNNKINILPDVFDGLEKLKELNCYNNALSKGLPDSFGELKSLESLNLALNEMKTLPIQICSLVNLKKLVLGRERLPTPYSSHFIYYPRPPRSNALETLPESFSSLQNLEELDLRYNNFTVFPSVVGELKNIKRFEIRFHKIVDTAYDFGTSPQELCTFENLVYTYNYGSKNCPDYTFDIKPDEDFSDIENLQAYIPIYIYNAGRNKCLRNTGNLDSPITYGDCDVSDDIVWFIPYSHAGYFRSKINPDYCLSMENGTENGKITLQRCTYNKFSSFSRVGNFIKPSISGSNFCLSTVKGSEDIIKKECNENDQNQIWYFNIWDTSFTKPSETVIVYLYNAIKNQCICSNGSSVTTGDCTNNDDTLWEIPNSHDGYYRSKAHPEQCLTVIDGVVSLSECNETTTLYLDGNFIRSPLSEDKCIATSSSSNELEYLEGCDVNNYNYIWYFNIWTSPEPTAVTEEKPTVTITTVVTAVKTEAY